MARSTIDDILEERRQKEKKEHPLGELDPSKFFSVLSAEGLQENVLELRFNDGLRSCFAYADLQWFNYSPDEGTLDLEFNGFLVSIIGRGLGERFFHSIKTKRAAWVKEADSDFQDNESNEIYIEQILISPPEGFGEGGDKP